MYSSQNRVSCGNLLSAIVYSCFIRCAISLAIVLFVLILFNFIRSFVKLIRLLSYLMYSKKSLISRDGCVVRYSKFSLAFFIFLRG